MRKAFPKNQKGFSLVELLVGVAVFTVIGVSIYGSYKSIFDAVYTSRARLLAVDLANEQLEIVRNLPYSDVGIQSGLPEGNLPHTQTLIRGGASFLVTITVRNIDDPFDGTLGGAPNDLSPADFKIVEVNIDCASCRNFQQVVVTSRVAPKNLETASTNGALFIKAFDANGNPVSDANVHVTNTVASPSITIDDVTNVSGMLQIVDAPPGTNAYNISVTKSGYSTEQTVVTSGGNPHPMKPPATVALQQVTQISFVIDRLSSMNVSSVTQNCSVAPSVSFNLKGEKLIGQNPSVYKYNNSFTTNGSGILNLSNLEWDNYTVNLTDAAYDLVGINPISPVSILPGSSVSLKLVVLPKSSNTVLVSVKDSLTNLPLSGVDVMLSKSGFTTVEKYTGQGYMIQSDWSGGAGQATSTDPTKYSTSDGNADVSGQVGDVFLAKIFGDYVFSGNLTSSSFDTGSASNFDKILWNPTGQPVGAGTPNVRFHVATNNDGGTWNYAGPDGTSATYYTTANQNISAINNGNRYLRYKMFLDTNSTSTSPNISDVSFTFTSDCTPPGQVYFNSLPVGTYDLHLSKSGYADQDVQIEINSDWQFQEILMIPN